MITRVLPRGLRRLVLHGTVEPGRPATGTVTLRAEQASVTRGDRLVLDAVDLDVVAGEVLALVGPNGAGKSTLLSALAGTVALSSGGITLHSCPLDRWHPAQAARFRAVLPQRNPVGFGFTVAEVVRMGRVPWARTPAARDDEAVVTDAMRRCDVDRFRDRVFTALSGGEQARAALARVLAQDTPTLLLDEPTAALDLRHQEAVMRIITGRARAGAAVVVVLHDLSAAAAYADRIAVLDGGRIAAAGPAEEVLDPVLLGAVYEHPVDVLPHPAGGRPLVVPNRRRPR